MEAGRYEELTWKNLLKVRSRLIRQEVQMKDLIDSILIGSLATYLPFWMWDGARDQIAGAVALVMIILLQRRWKNWTS